MTAILINEDCRALSEQRGQERFSIALPATAAISGRDHCVRVLNVAPGGAMFEVSTALAVESRLVFRCGTISVTATVAWQAGGRTGVSFDEDLDAREVKEQLSRSSAVAARRELMLRLLPQARGLHPSVLER